MHREYDFSTFFAPWAVEMICDADRYTRGRLIPDIRSRTIVRLDENGIPTINYQIGD